MYNVHFKSSNSYSANYLSLKFHLLITSAVHVQVHTELFYKKAICTQNMIRLPIRNQLDLVCTIRIETIIKKD